MKADDEAKLVEALEKALADWHASKPRISLLHAPPQDILDELAPKIEACEIFQAAAGKNVFSGNAGFVLHASSLAWPLLARIIYDDRETGAIPDAIKWFEKVFTTDSADGRVVVPIWGLTVDGAVQIKPDTVLLPFGELPDSSMKRRILAQSTPLWGNALWVGQRYFDKPTAALLITVPEFPYLGRPDLSAERLNDLDADIIKIISCLEAVFARHPIVAGSWFEYEDQDLDINSHENHLTWYVPEVEPTITSTTEIKAAQGQHQIADFLAIDQGWRDKVIKSINRFSLSQCRRNIADKLVDLALAYEILLGDANRVGAPIGWLVGLRGAQFIGGSLDERKALRTKINKVYQLRNKAAHGGRLDANDAQELETAFSEASDVYSRLMSRCLSVRSKPDWDSLELQP